MTDVQRPIRVGQRGGNKVSFCHESGLEYDGLTAAKVNEFLGLCCAKNLRSPYKTYLCTTKHLSSRKIRANMNRLKFSKDEGSEFYKENNIIPNQTSYWGGIFLHGVTIVDI